MVDKEAKKKPRRSGVDKHNDEANTRFEHLESRLSEFITKLDAMTAEMDYIKKQQQDLLDILKEKLK